jgi:hypothetical protein
MLSGMPPFTIFHVLLSLAGILTGLVVLYGLLTAKQRNGWTRFSGYHRSDQRHRILVPFQEAAAIAHSGRPFADSSLHRRLCSLWPEASERLAPNVRGNGGSGTAF